MSNRIKIPCIHVEQPIGTFYVGVIKYDDLIRISYNDVRSMKERSVERFSGIQRPLSPKREKELHKYVNLVDASFPTSVIVAIEPKHAKYIKNEQCLHIQDGPEIAKVIDGQHRIAGLDKFNGERFDLCVTIFVGMSEEDQALVFSTINLKHTKVGKSLVYDLFEFAKDRSPQKTCHTIARLLNSEPKSQLYHRIKVLGVASGVHPQETITQATFVESLMKYVSKDPMQDRDVLKRKRKKLTPLPDEELKKHPFQHMFVAKKDADIARIVDNYFSSVGRKWQIAWNSDDEGMILCRSTGFLALMRFLRSTYNELKTNNASVPSSKLFSEIFARIKLKDKDFNRERFIPGSSGVAELFRTLKDQAGIDD